MTPQLQQAIRLLQLSTLELQTEVQQALESNPLLEVAEEGEEGGINQESAWEGTSDSQVEASTASGVEDMAVPEPPAAAELSREEALTELSEIPSELPVDSSWDEIYDAPLATSSASDQEGMGFEGSDTSTDTLRDHLVWQLKLTPFSDNDFVVACSIIDAISEDGYLTVPLDSIATSLKDEHGYDLDIEEVEVVLHRVQNFDPPGVGARDLKECLLIQLNQMTPRPRWLKEAQLLISEHLNSLANRDYNHLMRRLKLEQQELQQVINLIQSLNPRPGSGIAKSQAEYVVPDVIVRKFKGTWRVELNSEAVPKLKINTNYSNMIRRADNSADNVFLKNHFQEARWFIKSLQSRNETLLKVASCIVERQRAFLEQGEEAMKALVLHDIAEAVGMHESTISRVTSQKYMHTPRGVFELKYFFSSHVSTSTGGACSATAIRALIKKLVAAESPTKPLSDSKIASVLAEQGINVARRTIAKYREGLAIPPSNERKRLE